MSDIVGWLRASAIVRDRDVAYKYREAADEIERLTAARDAAMRVHVEDGQEIERLQKQLVSDINAETEIDRLETEIERLRALVQCLLDNDPEDDAADGVTVLDVWRKEARRALEPPSR